MTGKAVATVNSPHLQGEAVSHPERLGLWLKGVADLRVQDLLAGFLDSAHRAALADGAREVEVDLTALEFMNSSCLAEFVRWIEAAQEDGAAYRIRFLSNPAHRWQVRSLDALSCLASHIVSVRGPSPA